MEYRLNLAFAGYYLEGLPALDDDEKYDRTRPIADVDEFLRIYRFQSLHEGHETGWTPLHFAVIHAYGRCEDLVAEMVKRGADLNVCLKEESEESLIYGFAKGCSILHSAMAMAAPGMVRLLLHLGANIRAKCDMGMEPLAVACLHNDREENVRELLSFAEKNMTAKEVETLINSQDRFGMTALVAGCVRGPGLHQARLGAETRGLLGGAHDSTL